MLAAALVGGAIGWLLRAAVRGDTKVVEPVEVDDVTADRDQLKARVAELEPVVADRERLRKELYECWAESSARSADVPAADHAAVLADRDRLAAAVAEREGIIGELRVRLWNSESGARELRSLVDAQAALNLPPTPDVAAAAAVLGKKIELDDLTVVEGIGPKIAELCQGKGITTWWQLAHTDPASLGSMLEEAGPRFQVHDPGTWPQQARLLATGAWAEFKSLTDSLRGGRS
jgi:predicted flap endonuclease-1-like 5' DNA nuclease